MMQLLKAECPHCGKTHSIPVQLDMEWMGRIQQMERENAALRKAVRQVGASVLNDWRGNDGSLRADTMQRLVALLRTAGASDLLWEGARTYEVVS